MYVANVSIMSAGKDETSFHGDDFLKPSPTTRNLGEGSSQPGDCVDMDQFVVRVPERLPNTSGKEEISNRFTGGTIFVDLVLGFTFVKM